MSRKQPSSPPPDERPKAPPALPPVTVVLTCTNGMTVGMSYADYEKFLEIGAFRRRGQDYPQF